MEFPEPLVPATLARRYKGFLADATLASGARVTAHCPNPGSMLGLAEPGLGVWLAPAGGPTRKLDWRWELVGLADGTLVGINAQWPNALVAEALARDAIAPLAGYAGRRREVRYGTNSRIDLLLEDADRPPCYVEVKNVHLKRDAGPGGGAEFPDSVTKRGAKHLDELARAVAAGARAVMVYVVQRAGCDHLRLAGDIDPAYVAAFDQAAAGGVEMLCYGCRVATDRVDIATSMPISH